MNRVSLIGNLTKDIELRYGANSQTAVARFTIAINRGKDKDGNDKGADFPTVTVFGKQAENCEKFLSKGSQVAVNGEIRTGSYEKADGTKVYTTEVVADYFGGVEFLGSGKKSEPKSEKPKKDDIPEGLSLIEDEEIPF